MQFLIDIDKPSFSPALWRPQNSQTPLSFHRLSRPWKAYPIFSQTFKDLQRPWEPCIVFIFQGTPWRGLSRRCWWKWLSRRRSWMCERTWYLKASNAHLYHYFNSHPATTTRNTTHATPQPLCSLLLLNSHVSDDSEEEEKDMSFDGVQWHQYAHLLVFRDISKHTYWCSVTSVSTPTGVQWHQYAHLLVFHDISKHTYWCSVTSVSTPTGVPWHQ